MLNEGKNRVSTVFPADKGRFMITGPFDAVMPNYYLIITDWNWWNDNEPEILEWMNMSLPKGSAQLRGMVVEFENELDASAFLLRWS